MANVRMKLNYNNFANQTIRDINALNDLLDRYIAAKKAAEAANAAAETGIGSWEAASAADQAAAEAWDAYRTTRPDMAESPIT